MGLTFLRLPPPLSLPPLLRLPSPLPSPPLLYPVLPPPPLLLQRAVLPWVLKRLLLHPMPLLLLLLPHAGTIPRLALFISLPHILGTPRRAPPSKRAWTSSLGESSSSWPQKPQSPPTQGPTGDLPPNLSPTLIIRRPYFQCDSIASNSDCSTRDLHSKVYYGLPAFFANTELRYSMLQVQRCSLEPFMTPCQFFYPQVVMEFYHTMTSK